MLGEENQKMVQSQKVPSEELECQRNQLLSEKHPGWTGLAETGWSKRTAGNMLVKLKEQKMPMLEMLTKNLSIDRITLSARRLGVSYIGHWIRIAGSCNSRGPPPHHSPCHWCHLEQHHPPALSVQMELFCVCTIHVIVISHMCPWTFVSLRKCILNYI